MSTKQLYYIKKSNETESSESSKSSELTSQWAIDFLTQDDTSQTLFSRYYIPVTSALCGTSTAAYLNISNFKPWYTSVQRLAYCGVFGYLVGTAMYFLLKRRIQRHSLHVLDCLRMHPERFVEERIRYKDMYKLDWMPLR